MSNKIQPDHGPNSDDPDSVRNRLREAWDGYANAWSSLIDDGADLFSDEFFIPAFLEFSQTCEAQYVLDLGCGEGRFSRHLARIGKQVVGVDFSPRMVQRAQAKEERESLGIKYVIEDFTSLSGLEPETFDAAYGMMSLMDAPEIRPAAAAVARVLRRGASLWLIVLHPCFQTRHPPGVRQNWALDQCGRKVGRISYHYFGDQIRDFNWRLSQLPDDQRSKFYEGPRVFHTLSDYFNGLIDGGFSIDAVGEPIPNNEVRKRIVDLRPWSEHAALALMIHCRKC